MARVQLQGIILADSFTTMFEPITLECPKVLLPLVNIPMIDHTLEWLESADVEQVFVLCSCSHSKQIRDYLDKSKWVNKPNFSVTTVEAGDALRDVIQSDFVLVSGDTVTNMKLKEALEEHKKRKENNNNAAFMTMVIKQSEHFTRDEIIMGIDPTTNQVLNYEDKTEDVKFEKSNLIANACCTLHNDKQDCYIDICPPQAVAFFTVDHQDLHRDLVKGLLADDKLKIFTHEMDSRCYLARIDSFRSYKSISKDIINNTSQQQAQVIGKDTIIGGKTVISNSVVGDGCKIGSNVVIDGCYIWNNVRIEDGCKVMHAILCDGVVMKAGAVLEPGVVLSYKVVVGQEHVVRSGSKVSLIPPQPLKQGGSDMGEDGSGFIWSMSEDVEEEKWRYWVPPPVRKRCKSVDEFFEQEVENIFLRAVDEDVGGINHILKQVNSLRTKFDIILAKCVGALLYSIMRLALKNSKSCGNCLVKETNDVISKWGGLLKGFLRDVHGKKELILKFEEMCSEESMEEYAACFVRVLYVLYDKGVIQENAIFKWADEKEHAVYEADKFFVKQSGKFILWLKEVPEEKDQEIAVNRLNDGGLQLKKRPLTETDLQRSNEGGVQVKKRRFNDDLFEIV